MAYLGSRHKTATVALAALLLAAGSAPTHGAVILDAFATGGDVVISGSGTIDLTAWGFVGSGAPVQGEVNPDGFIAVGAGLTDVYIDFALTFSGPTSIGPGSSTLASSNLGDPFGLEFDPQARIAVPEGYVSGALLSGSSTYAGASINSLGLTPGSYTWTWGSGASADSLTLNVIVPEPSTALLLAGGLAVLSVRRRAIG